MKLNLEHHPVHCCVKHYQPPAVIIMPVSAYYLSEKCNASQKCLFHGLAVRCFRFSTIRDFAFRKSQFLVKQQHPSALAGRFPPPSSDQPGHLRIFGATAVGSRSSYAGMCHCASPVPWPDGWSGQGGSVRDIFFCLCSQLYPIDLLQGTDKK